MNNPTCFRCHGAGVIMLTDGPTSDPLEPNCVPCPSCSATFNTKTILAEHPIYQKIGKQIDKGIEKYGTPINPENYSTMGWLNHLQEEMVDGLTYANTLEERLDQAKEIIDTLLNYNKDMVINEHLERLKQILVD